MAPQYKITGIQKIAVMMLAMGSDVSAKILKQYFTEEEIEKIYLQVAQIDAVPENVKDEVLKEFWELAEAQQYLLSGGVKVAKELLEKTVGSQRAKEIVNRLVAVRKKFPFSSLRKVEPKQLIGLISDENPQTIALILGYLDPPQASAVMASLPDERKVDIAKRIALLEQAVPEVVDEIDYILERKILTMYQSDYKKPGGIVGLADILNRVDRSTEKYILHQLESEDENLVEEIRHCLFTFEDIVLLDDLALQRVLKEIDTKDIALALKTSNENISRHFYKNLSQRVQEMIKMEIELMGPVRIKEVEEAQQKIVKTIKALEEAGEIEVSRSGDEEDVFV